MRRAGDGRGGCRPFGRRATVTFQPPPRGRHFGIHLSEGLGSLSRVHLLLVRLGEDVLAIDTASTNGTWRGRTEIETTPLGDVDSLVVGSVLRLHWRRLRSGGTDRG